VASRVLHVHLLLAGPAQGILGFKAIILSEAYLGTIILSVGVCKRFRMHMEKSKQSKIKGKIK
jgi:hypothetical protein